MDIMDVMIVVSGCINVVHRFGLQSLDLECKIRPNRVGNAIVLTSEVLVIKSYYGKRDLESVPLHGCRMLNGFFYPSWFIATSIHILII